MTTHIFVHLSDHDHGKWFRLDLKPHQIPRDIKEFCNTIMQTPDPDLVDKDRGGVFTALRMSTLTELSTYISQFTAAKRARPSEAETKEVYDALFPTSKPFVDDRLDEIIKWIASAPDKKHVVACRTKAGVDAVTKAFIRTDIDVDARHYRALQTGVRFDAEHVWFSAAFTVTDSELYARLTSRLHGSIAGNYNIKTGPKEPQ